MGESPVRVCCVEDNDQQFLLVRKILEKSPLPLQIFHLTNGEQLLEKKIDEKYDLILLDYKLPGKDGLEILKTIRSRGVSIPVIFISAYESEKVIADALECGADDFLLKDLGGNYLKIINHIVLKTFKKYQLQQENIILQQEMLYSQKMQSISTLAQGIAHDFNNALVGILGYADLMKIKLNKEDEIYSYAERIYSSAKRMSAWIKQLLTYSKLEEHKLQPITINSSIQKCIQILTPSLEKRVQIFTSLDHSLQKVNADKNQIEQALTNILLNSIESISGQGEIKISTENVGNIIVRKIGTKNPISNNYVHLIIEDNGAGMNKKTLERIFEPFFTTKFIGRGLGMAAVYGIIDNHNGVIHIDSELQKGTRIDIYLPALENVQKTETREISKNIEKSILVVDDELVTIEIVKKVFVDKGYAILEAHDGLEALEVYSKNPNVSLILLDFIMPKRDGIDILRDIKKINPNQKIIICSGYDLDPIIESIGQMADGFLLKPFGIQELINIVNDIMPVIQ
jgi:two-component system, cell cycle sensor histidine kinase and response regulator CckA